MAEEVATKTETGHKGPSVSLLSGSVGLWLQPTGVILNTWDDLGMESSMHCMWKLVPPPGPLRMEMKLLPSS